MSPPFDLADPANGPLLDYMAKQVCLVVDPQSSTRNAVRKLFSTLGVKSIHADAAETFAEGWELFQKKKPSILFCEYRLGTESGITFLSKVREAQGGSQGELSFFLMSDNNSIAVAAEAAEEEVDALIVRPFTFGSLLDQVVSVLSARAFPSPQELVVQRIRSLIDKQEWSAAAEAVSASEGMQDGRLSYFRGLLAQKQGDTEAAAHAYQKGAELDPPHYRCAVSLLDLYVSKKRYFDAYELGAKITEKLPLNPKRIPSLISTAIHSGNFEEIDRYADICDQFPNLDGAIKRYLAAGLVTAAKAFLRLGTPDETRRGNECLLRALRTAGENREVAREVAVTLLRSGDDGTLEKARPHFAPEIMNAPEVRLAEIAFLRRKGKEDEAYALATALLQQGIHSGELFRFLIEKSVALGRPAGTIQEWAEQAGRLYPEQKEEFLSLLKP